MKRITFDYCSTLLLIAVMSTASQAADLIKWASDLETARQAAVAQNKLLLIHFWAYNCALCTIVDEQVFPRPSVAQTLHESFVPLKINVDEYPELRLQFQVDRWPTDVVVTPGGQIVHKMVTPQDPQQYVHRLSAIALTKSPRTYNESRWARGPQARPPGVSSRPSEASRLGQDVMPFSQFGPGKMGQNGLMSNQVARNSRFSSRFSSRYGDSMQPLGSQVDEQQSAIPPRTTQPRAVTNGYVLHQQVKLQQQDPRPTHRSEDGVNNPYIGQQQSLAHTSAAGRFTPQPSEVYAQVRKPPVQPPLGLDGRCPVTLSRARVWQKGDPRWGAVHRGRTYLFVGTQEQQAFLADPDRFSPVLAGMDVVRLAEESRVVAGDRRYGVVYDDDGRGPLPSRIYLFDSADSRNRFEQGPDRFLRPVIQAMQQGRLDTLLR